MVKLLFAVASKWIGVVTLAIVPESTVGDCMDTAETVACALQLLQMNRAHVINLGKDLPVSLSMFCCGGVDTTDIVLTSAAHSID